MTDIETFENIDRLMMVEMRTQGIPRGIVPQLYRATRMELPLSLVAAEALRARGGKRVALITGYAGPVLPLGEVDGPIGAAVLARALSETGTRADVLVPRPLLPVMEVIRRVIHGDFELLPEEDANPDDYDAAVASEKLGHNRKGIVHSILGAPEDQSPVADEFIETLRRDGRLTIGLGDGGNEIGFGAIFDEARQIVPRGSNCGCPCNDGIVTSTATEILFPVSVSNFGSYAVATALGVLHGRPLLIPTGATIAEAIDRAVGAGCIDGGTFEPGRVQDDGIPIEGVIAVVTLLRTIAVQHFRHTPRHA